MTKRGRGRPRKRTGSSLLAPPTTPAVTLREEEDYRKELAQICGQAIKIFAQPCFKCDTDRVGEKHTADPANEFRFGLVVRVTIDGSLDPEDVYVVPLVELTSRSQRTKMSFGYGPERVSEK